MRENSCHLTWNEFTQAEWGTTICRVAVADSTNTRPAGRVVRADGIALRHEHRAGRAERMSKTHVLRRHDHRRVRAIKTFLTPWRAFAAMISSVSSKSATRRAVRWPSYDGMPWTRVYLYRDRGGRRECRWIKRTFRRCGGRYSWRARALYDRYRTSSDAFADDARMKLDGDPFLSGRWRSALPFSVVDKTITKTTVAPLRRSPPIHDHWDICVYILSADCRLVITPYIITTE